MTTTMIRPARDRSERQLTLGRIAVYTILILSSIIAIIPFVWMILASFKTGAEVRQVPPTFWPQAPTLDNYRTILNDPKLPLITFYRNSAIIAVSNVILAVSTSACSATSSPSSISPSNGPCSGLSWRR